MKSLQDITKNFKPKHAIVEEQTNLYCENCGRYYDWFKFDNGYEFRHGCDCAIKELGRQERQRNKQRKINSIFNQSHINQALKDVSVKSYVPQNNEQAYAKQTAIEYVKNFSLDNPRTIIFQGSYGTGKSHLSVAIAKALKKQGYTVAFMHIPKLMDRIKATYNKDAEETTDELVKLLSGIDLLILDDVGVDDTNHTLTKLFSIVDNRVGKNNIFTTNFTDKELKKSTDWQRINSRMKSNARRVKVIGKDYREQDAW
ncbi:ATP-binding protein [Staphylococcus capitis]|uniref:ATP-binding protein n=1 Tax=Staphylococcus capitis TaxID=29388 RepID=UPI001BD19F37|nr:ATP-binding protein [Staphylococcus capitis]